MSTSLDSRGITLAYLLGPFIDSFGGVESLRDKTTREVYAEIGEKTSRQKVSFLELLKELPTLPVREATCFVSHAHDYKFLDMINLLKEHLREEGDPVVWIDIFCFNQHSDLEIEPVWLQNAFSKLIAKIGRTVAVLDSWSQSVVFKRAWCVWEMFCAIESKGKLEIAISESEISCARSTYLALSLGFSACLLVLSPFSAAGGPLTLPLATLITVENLAIFLVNQSYCDLSEIDAFKEGDKVVLKEAMKAKYSGWGFFVINRTLQMRFAHCLIAKF